LIDAVAAITGEGKTAIAAAFGAILKTITGAVTKGDAVQLIGFGSFSVGVAQIDAVSG
jgi:DNA-binding protein HU-beta